MRGVRADKSVDWTEDMQIMDVSRYTQLQYLSSGSDAPSPRPLIEHCPGRINVQHQAYGCAEMRRARYRWS